VVQGRAVADLAVLETGVPAAEVPPEAGSVYLYSL
jgi:hypothetical protein